MTYTRKRKGKRRENKRRSLVAHSLEDPQFRLRVSRNRIKYTRKGKAHDRQHIRSRIEDDAEE
jgi:stalled ribosome alternative rescue factor ArfA